MEFKTKQLSADPDVVATDGSNVRILLSLKGGSMAHFELDQKQISKAVTHQTVEEIWYFLGGCGEMWRKLGDLEEIVSVESGICLTIPVGTHFQFRSFGNRPLSAVAVTMPPWPGEEEACEVEGKWKPTVG